MARDRSTAATGRAAASAVVEGQITLRGIPVQHKPPASYSLCDPSRELPLLQLTLARPAGLGPAPAGEWTRLKVWLWGVWSDRTSDMVQLQDRLRIEGGMWEADPEAGPGDCPQRLALPPRGAEEGAAVIIIGRRKPERNGDDWTAFEAEITERGVKSSRTSAAAGAAAGGAPDSDAAAAASRKKRAREYEYQRITDLPERGIGDPPSKGFDFFGVVYDYTLPRMTGGTDMKSTLELVDESCAGPRQRIVVNFFKAHPEPPGVGAVVRLHRVKTDGQYDGVRQAAAQKHLTPWVVGDLASGGKSSTGDSATWLDSDSSRVAALRAWSRRALASDFGGYDREALSLAQVMAAADENEGLDLLVCLGAAGAGAARAAENPARHGLGAPEPLPLFTLHDAPPAAGAPAGLPPASLVLDAHMAPLPAQHLLRHLRARAVAPQGAGAADPTAAPPAPPSAAALAAFRADYGGGWARLRNVRLGRLPAGGPAVVCHARSSLTRLPDCHAAVARRVGAPPAAFAGSQETISSFSSSADDPISSFSSHASAAPGAAAPGAAPGAAAGGAGGAAAGGAGGAARCAAAARGAPSALGGGLGGAPRLAPAPPAPRTRCGLRELDVLSIGQVQDRHAQAPCVMRARAKLLQALPADPLLWTQPLPGGGGFAYRMVLQLEDVDKKEVWLGALLLGEQAEAFFPGLPPADLRASNVTLARLRETVAALCDSVLEVGLVSYRPDPAKTGEHDVAYRVVSTTPCAR